MMLGTSVTFLGFPPEPAPVKGFVEMSEIWEQLGTRCSSQRSPVPVGLPAFWESFFYLFINKEMQKRRGEKNKRSILEFLSSQFPNWPEAPISQGLAGN